MNPIRVCSRCGRAYVSTNHRHRFCEVCRDRKDKPKIRPIRVRPVSKMRVCPVCGREFRSAHGRVYCTDECAKEAGRRRQRKPRSGAPCGRYATCFECREKDCNWGGA